MDFRVLGPLEVEGKKGPIPITGAKERAVLALLLIRANRFVPRDVLIDEVWGGHPPETARHTLAGHVSRLRRALATGGNGSVIESHASGYRVRVEDGEIDALRFERLLEEGRSASERGALEQAEERLAAGLGLWRGPALADLADEPFAAVEALRLEELRLAGVEARMDVALRLGHGADLVGELQALVAANPLRERLRAELMRALYRAGRQADALAYYRDGRRTLDELGIEPSRELKELEQAILQHDAALESPLPAATPPPQPVIDRAVTLAETTAAPAALRKVVTVLVCDVMDSIGPEDRLDPEVLRVSLDRFFTRMKAIAELHGGTMENGSGNVMMAVFGVPVAHEDDTLRACRAALEIRHTLPDIGLHGRIGIENGDVLTNTSGRLAIGEPVETAAWLQQGAAEDEVLVGARICGLLGPSAVVEAVPALEGHGNRDPLVAFRLLSVAAGAEAISRHFETAFVGRENAMAALREEFEKALTGPASRLVTVIGEPGIGKTRLLREFAQRVGGRTRVLSGRCLPYGDGITYWPLRELLYDLCDGHDLAGELRSLLDGDAEGERIVDLLRGAIGATDGSTGSVTEVQWAARRLFETLATGRPLLVLLEDLHWAEPTFLQLVEYIAACATEAPITLLAAARDELLYENPTWAVPQPHSRLLTLEPLRERDANRLIDALTGDRPVPDRTRARLLDTSGGNPLFLEQLVALQGEEEDEDGDLPLPATINALLAARLDRLPTSERDLLGRAAVEGLTFHRGPLTALLPDHKPTDLGVLLLDAIRRNLIRSCRSQLPHDDGYQFAHALIRDAAYQSMPKELRVHLHEKFADWIEQRLDGSRGEIAEIVGYHLEQAAYAKQELGLPDPALAERAGDKLAAAGRRAAWRGDHGTAIPLLERALALTRPTRLDVGLEVDLAGAVGVAAPLHGAEIAEAAAELAHAADNAPGEALARVIGAGLRVLGGALTVSDLEPLARRALPLLERADDHAGLARVWSELAGVADVRGRYDDVVEAFAHARHHARLAGQPRGPLRWLAYGLVMGSRPAAEALEELHELLPDQPSPVTALRQARLLAMLGRFDDVWKITTEASRRASELGLSVDWQLAAIASLAGDHEAAAEHLHRQYEVFDQRGELGTLITVGSMLGRELCLLGRYDEAEPLVQRGYELLMPDDVPNRMLLPQVQALIASRRGEHDEAERLAREAVEISTRMDSLNWQADALCDLAAVLENAGRAEEAAAAFREALDRYERKQNLVMAEQVRARLEGGRRRLVGDH